MASINGKVQSIYTHEGAKAKHISSLKELERSIMACMLWENEFYESGVTISDRIKNIIANLPIDKLDQVAELAIKARNEQYLRHIPLFILRELVRSNYPIAKYLYDVVQRPDELTEFLAIYWKDGKVPLAKQVKKGLALAFTKFNEYSLAKYNRDNAIKLRDVLFMVHAKPKNEEQASVWKKLVDNKLAIPDTWETNLSIGKDKKETWERLIGENKLGGLAALRNLRNMQEVNVSPDIIRKAIRQADYSKVLPFRFIAASRFAPSYEDILEEVLFNKLNSNEKLSGNTILLVDVSGSMNEPISEKSDMRRMDAGYGLAIILRQLCENIKVFTFSNYLVEVPNRRGFALRDAMDTSQAHSSTELGAAIRVIKKLQYDRLIVITDEQSSDTIPNVQGKNYMLNVASNKNGIGYGDWVHIDGFSEACINYIVASEKEL